MQRSLNPELLDSLPPDHPDARASRRDLRRINWFMGNHRWIERVLERETGGWPQLTVVEPGAGDGQLAQRLNRNRRLANRLHWHGIDLVPPPAGWPAGWAWDQADLRHWPGWAGHEIVVGCLCLHHFQQECLAAIGARLRQTARLVILAEPVRRRIHQQQGSLLALLGANHVTRHDLRVSVQAGFRHDELAAFLGLDRSAWTINITERFLGSYRLVARRR